MSSPSAALRTRSMPGLYPLLMIIMRVLRRLDGSGIIRTGHSFYSSVMRGSTTLYRISLTRFMTTISVASMIVVPMIIM